MVLGPYDVGVHVHGRFRLDGGAMFGSVPKPLWSRLAPADDQNRIEMVARSLVVRWNYRKLIVDLGCGDKWDARSREIFSFDPQPAPIVEGVTDILITHFHFDHAGGISSYDGADRLVPRYPGARHYIPGANLENARHPNVRERASYLAENLSVLPEVECRITDDGDEIWPGLRVHRADGHTVGLLWVTLQSDGRTIAFPSDLVPTAAHLPVPYVMGYDICAATAMEEKAAFLDRALAEKWIVVFGHDPIAAAGTIGLDQRGRPEIAEPYTFSNLNH